MEQLDYNLLYRWFVGLTPDDAVWVPDGLHQEPRSPARRQHRRGPFNAVVGLANAHQLLSHEHFTVESTLLEMVTRLPPTTRRRTLGVDKG
jgi:hypothetical protein